MGDYKSFLFTWCAKTKKPSPNITFRESGTNTQKRFICEVGMEEFNYIAVGNSTNKKDAQMNAIRDFVLYLVRSQVIPSAELNQTLKNQSGGVLEVIGSKPGPLGLNKPGFSVYQPGQGPESLGAAYQPVNRSQIDYAALDKRTVDEQETLDVNASIHGNWTVNEAKNRLNQFMQMNKIKGEYKYSFVGPDNAKTFIAELKIFVPQLGRNLTGRESGSSKMAASKSCALSLIRQLFHLGVVERCSSVTGTAPKRQEQMPPYQVSVDPELLDNISVCLQAFGIDWESQLACDNKDGVITLLAGRQAEKIEDDNKTGRVVSWSPPTANWDPWRGANIDDANPNLANASMDCISDELKKGTSVASAERDRTLRQRTQLPIYPCKKQILSLIASHPVIIIKGATGCGKTTQVCQYILDSWIEEGRGSECNIVVTQPRRISAISVAERVAKERYEDVGISVGYSVRFESMMPRPYGAILFCTVGVLLKKLELGLRGISHVFVDEIHERDVNTDFLLIVLRDMLHIYPDLRVVLMSATVDTQLFSAYFNNCPVIEVPGQCYDVHTYFLEDAVEMLRFVPPPTFKKKSKSEPVDESEEEADPLEEYDPATRSSIAQLDDKEIPFELIHEILLWCRGKGTGAVLVFLPGWNTIFSLMKRLLSSPEFRKPSYVILPLHSQLPREEQRVIFEEPPHDVMKIILSTNIAESSITINDVIYVIDCCKVKVKMFTSHNNMVHYATVWASRSNMKQRAGRAGRTANGYCFRLCTKSRYARLEEHIVAEMLRTSLDELSLSIKLLGLGSIAHFLSKALEPPPLDAVIEAQVLLKEMHCLDKNYELTPLGRLVAKLPLDPRMARMCIIGCMLELGDAAAAIASNISLASEVFDIESSMTGRQRWFAGSRYSDQLAMLNAFQRFQSLEFRGGLDAQQDFTCVNQLSFPALVLTGEAKSQIKEILSLSGFPAEAMQQMSFNFAGEDPNLDLMAALLTAGSYPNVCYHKERRKVLTTESKPALIIKTSVNCSRFTIDFPSPFFVFNEKLRTKTVYCRTLGMVTPVHLLLFGCNQVDVIKNIVKLDGWMQLDMDARAAALILSLRPLIESIVAKVAASPDYIYEMTDLDKEVISLLKQLANFNSGRYRMQPYCMSKEGTTRKRMTGAPRAAQPPRSFSNNNDVDLQISSSFQRNVNISKSDRYGGEGSSNRRNIVPDPNMSDDEESDSYSEDSTFPHHSELQVLKHSDLSVSAKASSEPAGKYQPAKPVKLDPNTSRAVLARHQQRAVETLLTNVDSAPAVKSDSDQSGMNPPAQAHNKYANNYSQPSQGSRQSGYARSPRNNDSGYNSNRQNRMSDPYYREEDYQLSDSYIQNSFQNNAPKPYPRSSVRGGNSSRQNMYSSANYYKQRYSQPMNSYRDDSYRRDPQFDEGSNNPYFRGNKKRSPRSTRGRGYSEGY